MIVAKDLLRKHREAFRTFWQWSDGNVDYALLHKKLWTVFGWQIQVAGKINARSLANFPMQANGAEMLRIACILMTEAGIRVCAPVHDAVLIEAPLEELDDRVKQAQDLMNEASRQLLGGFELTTDADFYRYPERYRDEEGGGAFWDKVMDLLPENLLPTDLESDHLHTGEHIPAYCRANGLSIILFIATNIMLSTKD